MPDEKVLQVAILIWGCAFCAIAALCIFLSSNYNREKRRYLVLMESFASLLLLMDAQGHIFSGYPGVPGSVMVRISSFLVFLLSDVVLVCFHIYMCVYLFSKKERRTLKRVKAGYVIATCSTFSSGIKTLLTFVTYNKYYTLPCKSQPSKKIPEFWAV